MTMGVVKAGTGRGGGFDQGAGGSRGVWWHGHGRMKRPQAGRARTDGHGDERVGGEGGDELAEGEAGEVVADEDDGELQVGPHLGQHPCVEVGVVGVVGMVGGGGGVGG